MNNRYSNNEPVVAPLFEHHFKDAHRLAKVIRNRSQELREDLIKAFEGEDKIIVKTQNETK